MTAKMPRRTPTCSGLQSKRPGLAISAVSGSDYLRVTAPASSHSLRASLQSSAVGSQSIGSGSHCLRTNQPQCCGPTLRDNGPTLLLENSRLHRPGSTLSENATRASHDLVSKLPDRLRIHVSLRFRSATRQVAAPPTSRDTIAAVAQRMNHKLGGHGNEIAAPHQIYPRATKSIA